MRRLKIFTWVIVAGSIPGAVATVLFAWYNSNPSSLVGWGAALREWQPAFWIFGASGWFTAWQVLVNDAGGHEGVTPSVEDDLPTGRTVEPAFGIHPITNNATWGDIDSQGYSSGNHPLD